MAGFYNYISCNSYIYHNHSITSSKLPNMNEILKKNQQYYFSKHYLAEYTWLLNRENYKFRKKLEVYEHNLICKIIYFLEKNKQKIIRKIYK